MSHGSHPPQDSGAPTGGATPVSASGPGAADAGRLLLIDGHSMAFRAFFALPADRFSTSTGQSTNAVYGFTSMLVKLMSDEEPTHVAVAWDRSEPTFRHERYPAYKAGRDETPPELPSQVELLQELMGMIGVHSVSVPGFEADDIIATLATRARDEGASVLIASGDRDAFQLVNAQCTVLYPGRTPADLTRMTPEALREKYGVDPQRYRDLAALVGEKSDNLPGVPGVGPKTAAKWIAKYGSASALAEHAEEIGGKAGENLRGHLSDVTRNLELNELCTTVDTGVSLAELTLREGDRPAVHSLFDTLEFGAGLRERLDAAVGWDAQGAAASAATPATEVSVAVLGTSQVADWIAAHTPQGAAVGVDVVGTWGAGTGEVMAVTVCDAEGDAATFDPAALDGADEAAVAAWLGDERRPKVLHDAKGPLLAFGARGWSLRGLYCDTRLAAYLLTPGRRDYDLAGLCQEYLSRELHSDDSAGQLALDVSGDGDSGGGRRAAAVLELGTTLMARLGDRGESRLLSEVELPLVSVLAEMERAGIACDLAQLRGLEEEFAAAVRQAESEAHRVVGHAFNLGSPKQLQAVLFDELGLPKTKRIKTGYTTDADALAWLAQQRPDSELPAILLRHRDQTKLRTTVEGLIKTVADDGRIHTTYNQAVAATGRLSSVDPNMQNIPVRTDAGRRIRHCFVPGESHELLLTADYSQIELRVMAHLSGDESLIDAFASGRDFHTETAARVFGISPDKVDGEARARIKGMNYGLAYGLSAFGLGQQLGVSPEEARRLMEDYFSEFGAVRDYLHRVVEQARRDGYTATMMGRRRYLPDLTSGNRQRREMAERMALNAPIQGSAADIIKVAMLRVRRAFAEAGVSSRLLLQVHDELVVETTREERDTVARLMREEMGGAVELRVPLDVSVGTGGDWQDAAH